MEKEKQNRVFLKTEGDAWFSRNKKNLEFITAEEDPVLKTILALNYKPQKVLEIGCSNGWRLKEIQTKFNSEVTGIEPSKEAIQSGKRLGLKIQQGTADDLPFENEKFDLVIFGFCLYLCDRKDLFKIAYEADRVLQDKGIILIYDFFCKSHSANKYHHYPDLNSYKMDYSKIFRWHPSYELIFHQVFGHDKGGPIDAELRDWVATSVLMKRASGYSISD